MRNLYVLYADKNSITGILLSLKQMGEKQKLLEINR